MTWRTMDLSATPHINAPVPAARTEGRCWRPMAARSWFWPRAMTGSSPARIRAQWLRASAPGSWSSRGLDTCCPSSRPTQSARFSGDGWRNGLRGRRPGRNRPLRRHSGRPEPVQISRTTSLGECRLVSRLTFLGGSPRFIHSSLIKYTHTLDQIPTRPATESRTQ